MRVDIITKEYPPEIYGGAGVHVTELVKALREQMEVQVRAFGEGREEDATTAYGVPAELSTANGAIQTLGTDLEIVTAGLEQAFMTLTGDDRDSRDAGAHDHDHDDHNAEELVR